MASPARTPDSILDMVCPTNGRHGQEDNDPHFHLSRNVLRRVGGRVIELKADYLIYLFRVLNHIATI